MSNITRLGNYVTYEAESNKNLVVIDERILTCEIVGTLNEASSWGNRQAEHRALSAYKRTKVRTSLGQKAIRAPGSHLIEDRSGGGDYYGWESNFAPHSFTIVTEEKFEQWLNQLNDDGTPYMGENQKLATLPSRLEVRNFLQHVVFNMARSLTGSTWQESEALENRIKSPKFSEPGSLLNHILYYVEIAKELNSKPRDAFMISGFRKE